MLVVADKTCKNQLNRVESVLFEDHPINVTYNDTLHCRKLTYSPLYRKTGKYCFNRTVSILPHNYFRTSIVEYPDFYGLLRVVEAVIIILKILSLQENLKFQKHLCSTGHKFRYNQILVFLAILLVTLSSTKM